MRYFDRYSTDLKNMDLAYSEYSHFHLTLANYGVTKDECAQYLSKLKDAQKKNYEKNKERKGTLKTLTICIGLMLSFIPIYAIYIFHELPYLIKWILGAGSWGAILYLFNKTYEFIDDSKILYIKLFPPINEGVESLFDDYLKEEETRIHELLYGEKEQ